MQLIHEIFGVRVEFQRFDDIVDRRSGNRHELLWVRLVDLQLASKKIPVFNQGAIPPASHIADRTGRQDVNKLEEMVLKLLLEMGQFGDTL